MFKHFALLAGPALWFTFSSTSLGQVAIARADNGVTTGSGLVVGESDHSPDAIGPGSVLLNLSTNQPNRMEGSSYLRMIFGGYDTSICGDVAPGGPQDCGASAAIATHHSAVLPGSSHFGIFSGSNLTGRGHYSAMLGGTQGVLHGDYGGMLPGVGLGIYADFALARGRNGTVTAEYGEVRGRDGVSHLPFGATQAAGAFTEAGDAQATDLVRKVESESCAPVPMQTLPLPDNTVWAFDVMVAVRQADADVGAAYKINGAIKKGTTALSTAFIGSPTILVLGEDEPVYDAYPVANASQGGLQLVVECAGRWVASYRLTEVSGLN